jgi:diaminopimelate epimerase
MSTRFHKLHGLGNDFILIDATGGGRNVTPEEGIALCDRHRGIGADGVLWLGAAGGAACRLVITNSDGSRAEMCGNGIRCVAKYLHDAGVARTDEIPILTDAGLLTCKVFPGADGRVETVRVAMGRPRLERSEIPMQGSGRCIDEPLEVEGRTLRVTAVSMGNPHAVSFGDASRELALALGPRVEHHPLFPRRTNVELARVLSRTEIDLTVWERGCGLTQACGTGACATTVAAVLNGLVEADREVRVNLPGGALFITVPRDLSNVWMRGPATYVFSGEAPVTVTAG